jgi:ubiquinone/menaquinone biosynthesis C-methylase UbiE
MVKANRVWRCELTAKNDVERFHEWSATYDDSWFQKYLGPLHEKILERISRYGLEGSSPQTVVDLGCGTGRLLTRAGKHWPGARLVGIDPASGMIEVARANNPNAEFYQAPAESIPLADETADVVLSSVSMHHWNDAGLGIREAHRILRKGGMFCLADIAVPRWLARLFHSKAKSRAALHELFSRPRSLTLLIPLSCLQKAQERFEVVLLVVIHCKMAACL